MTQDLLSDEDVMTVVRGTAVPVRRPMCDHDKDLNSRDVRKMVASGLVGTVSETGQGIDGHCKCLRFPDVDLDPGKSPGMNWFAAIRRR